jgi:hypothetical protein
VQADARAAKRCREVWRMRDWRVVARTVGNKCARAQEKMEK